MNKLIYRTDVSLLDHSHFMATKDSQGQVTCYYFDREEDLESASSPYIDVYRFDPEPSVKAIGWIDNQMLKSLNETMDSTWEIDRQLNVLEQAIMMHDISLYYGPLNFDSQPDRYTTEEFEAWLKSLDLDVEII